MLLIILITKPARARFMKIIFYHAFIIMSFISVSLYGQNKISGTVTNEQNGNPLERVNVFIPELHKGTVTNSSGNFELDGIPNGTFDVEFSFIGFKNLIISSQFRGKNVELNVSLKPTNLEIGEVVVLGNSILEEEKVPYKVETVSSKQLQTIPQPTLAAALAQLPGVSVMSSGLGISKPVIRGMYGYRISTIINGVRFDNQEWQNEHGLGIDNVGIGKIQIIEGPAALLYGADALGGVINLVPEKNAPVGKTVGEYNMKIFSNTLGANGNLSLKGTDKKLSWQLNAGGESHADYLDGNGKKISNTRFAGLTLNGRLGYEYNWGVSNLNYSFAHHLYGVVELKELNNPKDLNEDHFERGFEGPHHIVDYHIASIENTFFAGASKFKVNLGFQNDHRVEQEGADDPGTDAGELDVIRNTFSYDGEWIRQINQTFEFTLGTQGQFQNNENDGGRILVPNAKMNEISFFGYLKKDFNFLQLQGGIRYDSKKITTETMGIKDSVGYMPALDLNFNTLNGAIGASFSVSENLIFKLNIASGYRSPNLAELSSNGIHEGTIRYELGNPNMKSEKNVQGDIGLTFQTESIKIQASYFHNRVNDYIYLNPTSTKINSYQVYNFEQSDAVLEGGELSIDAKPNDLIDISASYSSVIGTGKNNSYLPLMPADKILAGVKFNLPNIKQFTNVFFSVSTRNYLKQSRIAAEETVTPSYTLLDAGIGSHVKVANIGFNWTLQGTNILNKTYIDHLSIIKPLGVFDMGTNIVLTLDLPFEFN